MATAEGSLLESCAETAAVAVVCWHSEAKMNDRGSSISDMKGCVWMTLETTKYVVKLCWGVIVQHSKPHSRTLDDPATLAPKGRFSVVIDRTNS